MDEVKHIDCIYQANDRGELILPVAHYAIINSNNKFSSKLKIVIYGLGSCVAPIIYDKKLKIAGMSHILVPNSRKRESEAYPHKYAELSVKLLVEELLNHGARKENLVAIIVGGAKIFRHQDCEVGARNVKMVKNELKKLNIKLIKEDTGGFRGRIIEFNSYNFSVSVKMTGNPYFKGIF